MHLNDELRRNQFGGLGCGELSKTLDFVTAAYIQGAREPPPISREFTPMAGLVNCIDSPRGCHWLWLCSSKEGPSWWVPALIRLRHNGFAVPVMAGENHDARVYFPKELCDDRTDLRYFEIGAIFAQLGHAAEIAQEMLERVKGSFRTSFNTHDGFIDAAVVLIFGVEAARNWSTCATSLMLLELIAGKHPHASERDKLFTLAGAFHPETGNRPMATIHRELSILRHWLDRTELLDDYNQLSVKGRILKLLRTYLG